MKNEKFKNQRTYTLKDLYEIKNNKYKINNYLKKRYNKVSIDKVNIKKHWVELIMHMDKRNMIGDGFLTEIIETQPNYKLLVTVSDLNKYQGLENYIDICYKRYIKVRNRRSNRV